MTTNTNDTVPPHDDCAICGDDGPDLRTLQLRYLYELTEISPKLQKGDDEFYTIRTCKDCRADFLNMLGKFCRGELRTSDTEGANIPVRIDGTTRMLTLEEYNQWKKKQ